MHIVVTNDDAPPSAQASPYILPFVHALEAAGHLVSVVIPHTQRSWIGKAHLIGQDAQSSPYHPPATTPETADAAPTASTRASTTTSWTLINSTPATCAQLALTPSFLPPHLPPVDLLISGPNYGRNTTALFTLSSGTLGAALEGALCGARAIALSFAFTDRLNRPHVVKECCEHAVRLCGGLAERGGEGVWGKVGEGRVVNVNMPLQEGVSGKGVEWTKVLGNSWGRGACFEEVAGAGDVGGAAGEEKRVREGKGDGGGLDGSAAGGTRHFKWSPRFADVYESTRKGGPGSDGWAVQEGKTSVTVLRANFMHVDGFEGEVKL